MRQLMFAPTLGLLLLVTAHPGQARPDDHALRQVADAAARTYDTAARLETAVLDYESRGTGAPGDVYGHGQQTEASTEYLITLAALHVHGDSERWVDLLALFLDNLKQQEQHLKDLLASQDSGDDTEEILRSIHDTATDVAEVAERLAALYGGLL